MNFLTEITFVSLLVIGAISTLITFYYIWRAIEHFCEIDEFGIEIIRFG